jgi:hypothetical protein
VTVSVSSSVKLKGPFFHDDPRHQHARQAGEFPL